MSSCLVVGSAYHKSTNAKVERANAVISDTLRAYANGRKDRYLSLVNIKNATKTLDAGLTAFFIDHGAHPAFSFHRSHCGRTIRAANATRGSAGGAEGNRWTLDAGPVDAVFQVSDQVLHRIMELLDAADIGKLRPRWEGPIKVTAAPSPNAYTLALPRPLPRCAGTVEPDSDGQRRQPFFAWASPAPGPMSDAMQEDELEVKLLLNRRVVRQVRRPSPGPSGPGGATRRDRKPFALESQLVLLQVQVAP